MIFQRSDHFILGHRIPRDLRRVYPFGLQHRLGSQRVHAVREDARVRGDLSLWCGHGPVHQFSRRVDARGRQGKHLHGAGRGVVAVRDQLQRGTEVGNPKEEGRVVAVGDVGFALYQGVIGVANGGVVLDGDADALLFEQPPLDGHLQRHGVDARYLGDRERLAGRKDGARRGARHVAARGGQGQGDRGRGDAQSAQQAADGHGVRFGPGKLHVTASVPCVQAVVRVQTIR